MLRQAKSPLIAVVRLRKRNEWVLPKGKLDDGETPRDAAEREVNEETGHDVIVHEFLGTLVYESGGRSKVVHYWRMQADGDQVYELMTDIREVDWLPLDAAVDRLSRSYERAFLENVGPIALSSALADLSKKKARPAAPTRKRRPRMPAPVQPPPAAPVPVQLGPVPASVVLSPMAPEVPAIVANEDANDAPVLEMPDASMPAEPTEPMQAVEAVELAVDAPACEPEAADMPEADPSRPVAPAEPADAPASPAAEPRRKTFAKLLRGWLGSAA